jgi:hypothetical protein
VQCGISSIVSRVAGKTMVDPSRKDVAAHRSHPRHVKCHVRRDEERMGTEPAMRIRTSDFGGTGPVEGTEPRAYVAVNHTKHRLIP